MVVAEINSQVPVILVCGAFVLLQDDNIAQVIIKSRILMVIWLMRVFNRKGGEFLCLVPLFDLRLSKLLRANSFELS
jgi:hypothetical protein